MLGVPVAEQTRVLIDGDVDAAAGDEIGDLIAWLPGPAGGRRELVRRCGTPGTCGDLVAVGLERVTEGLRPREEPRRHASPREVLEPAVDDASDFLAPVQEQQPDDLLDEASLERLEAARPESRAFEGHAALLIEERVRLELVREERRIATVELEADTVGQFRSDLLEQGVVAVRAMIGRRHEVDSVGVGFERNAPERSEAIDDRSHDL